jgi:hypothetical protein
MTAQRTLLVFGVKTFKITIPTDAKITFGPFSPPTKNSGVYNEERAKGTLRVYRGGPRTGIQQHGGGRERPCQVGEADHRKEATETPRRLL